MGAAWAWRAGEAEREESAEAARTRRAIAALNGMVLCPECFDPGPHPTNGADRLGDLTFSCTRCGEWFELEA